MYEKVQETAKWLSDRISTMPTTAIVLGTGLGRLATEIAKEVVFPYEEIPNFPISTVEGHSGRLIVGKLGDSYVLAMEGRFHYYEGYTIQETTFPIRVMHALGIDTLFVSNASGGTNPNFKVGDLMLITDHINFLPEHPLHGKNFPTGPRFPDMTEAYDKGLLAKARTIAQKKGIKIQEGVYLATQGPSFETPAESRMFALWGADTVGMSTVPEVIVANHCGMKCFGISVITNICVGDNLKGADHKEVQEAANEVQPLMAELMREMINCTKNCIE